jgi:hypothetical protein
MNIIVAIIEIVIAKKINKHIVNTKDNFVKKLSTADDHDIISDI